MDIYIAMNNIEEVTIKSLVEIGFLPGPEESKCGKTKFKTQNSSKFKTTNFCYRCMNKKCKKYIT